MPRFKYGDIVKLANGLTAKVLTDHGDEYLFVLIHISGWGDPLHYVPRTTVVTKPIEDEIA